MRRSGTRKEADAGPDGIREQVTVAAALLLGRMADQIVDDTLDLALAGQGGEERVRED